GRDHAKWQAIQAPSYRMEPIIEFDKSKLDEVKGFVDKLPEDLVTIKGDKLILKDIKKLPVIESYINKENIDFITIKRDPTKFLFSFETDGSFSAKDAIIESVKILEGKYTELGKLLKDIK
ncbi:MAG: hypothetical protein JSU91_06400, partial [Thermoplasmatales archaeon]